MAINWHLDDGYHIDWGAVVVIENEEFTFSITEQYIHRPFKDAGVKMVIESEITLNVLHFVALDLLRLIPLKYHSSQILKDFIDEVELQTGSWFTAVRDIYKLLNPDLVASREYLKQLGALTAVTFPPEDVSTEAEIRRNIVQAVDWYKVKGSYLAVQIISMIQKFDINFYDMYTNDYVHFYMTDWFVGDEGENPPGFDSSYYKSPHFGIEILLDKVYGIESSTGIESGEASNLYLWQASYLNNLHKKIEEVRPVHTVPHFVLLLNPKTDELSNVIETSGEIYTKVLANWITSSKYFDMEDSGEAWNFDGGIYFDQLATSFLKSITKWVLGTGNYPSAPENFDAPGFDVENPVLTGSIDPDNIVISEEKIIFEFIVEKGVEQNDISELGLYIPGSPDKLVLGSCFPKIDKDSRVELRVMVEVFRKSLLPQEVLVPASVSGSGS